MNPPLIPHEWILVFISLTYPKKIYYHKLFEISVECAVVWAHNITLDSNQLTDKLCPQ